VASQQTLAQPKPLGREALFRNIGPLVGAAYLGLLSLAISASDRANGQMLVQAATLTTLTVTAMLIVPWHRLPGIVQVGPALSYVLVALWIRQATGGAESIFAQLVLVPILWLAVYGSLGEVTAGVAAIALAMTSSLLLTPDPQGQLSGAVMLIVFGGAVGFGVQRLFAFLRAHAAQLDMLARTDPLTGASNRRAWEEELEKVIDSSEETHAPVCAALIDLDHFKEFNDARGHQAGDRLLKEVTARWRSQLRDGDVLARLGGDEFAVLLPGCPLEAAERIVSRLVEEMPQDATCSTGLASWDGIEGPGQFLARADIALYGAKDAGRNRVVVA
jgi:diguanylate cyclase (GGDEF)-like protein